jgi:F-box protein 9
LLQPRTRCADALLPPHHTTSRLCTQPHPKPPHGRYYRFFPNGQLLYRTSPHVLKLVARSLARTPAALAAARANPAAHARGGAADDAQHVYVGRYCVSGGGLRTVIVYPNSRGTEVRAKLSLRATTPGAANRIDVESLCTYDWETGTASPFPSDPAADELDAAYGSGGAERQEHRRGLAPFVFVPWEQVLTHTLNLPPSKMDVYLPG